MKGSTSRCPGRISASLRPNLLRFSSRRASLKLGMGLEENMVKQSSSVARHPKACESPWTICGKVAAEEGRDPNRIKIIVGINIIVAATDEEAKAKGEEYLRYADDEGALALFGGWTEVDLSGNTNDEDFRFAESPRVQSIMRRWSATVPGSDNLPWTKRRIVEYLSVGGLRAKALGSPATVADELERWVEGSGVDGFNLAHIY